MPTTRPQRTPLTKDEHSAISHLLSEMQTQGHTGSATVDRDWLLEDGRWDAFFLYYFPNAFTGVYGYPQLEELNYRLVEALEGEDRLMAWLPGGFGKSTTLLYWMIYVIAREHMISFIYVEKNDPTAKQRARAIMTELEGNHKLIHDFGNFKGDPWSAEAFTIAQRPRTSQWPTLSVFGAKGAALGNRCNIAIADDLVTSDNSSSELERQRLWDWYTQAFETCAYPLDIKRERYLMKTILVGTTFHMEDLYHTVERRARYKHLWLKAVDENNHVLSNRFAYMDEKEVIEDDDEESKEKLRLIRAHRVINLLPVRRADTRAFMTRYQNEVVDPNTAKFPLIWIEGGEDDLAPPGGYPGCLDTSRSLGEEKQQQEGWRYVTAVDPAAGTKGKWMVNFACTTLACDPKEPAVFYLVDMDVGQYPLQSDNPDRKTQVDVVLDQVQKYGSRIALETNNIQGVYSGVLREAARRRGMTLSISGQYTSAQKKVDFQTGIDAMQAMVENGNLRLPWRTPHDRSQVKKLIDEMVYLGVYGTDDILMALWIGWRVLTKVTKGAATTLKATALDRPYISRSDEWKFPSHWTERQIQNFLNPQVDEEGEVLCPA
jgi:hypothetical protein